MVAGLAVALAVLGGLLLLARVLRNEAAGDLELHRLGEGVYVYRGYFSNSAVFVLERCVVVVDTQVSPVAATRLRKKIEALTDLPVRYVINTHYHGDHTGGNAAFPGAEIIASEDTARFVVERDGERVEYADTFGLAFAEVHPTIPPTRTFRGSLRLEIDGDALEILQLGRAETPDAAVVIWPSRRAVACGDAVATRDYPYLGVPFLDEGLRDDGEWLGLLARVKAMRPEYLIAGHGPPLVGARAIARRLDLLARLMSELLGAVKRELAAGTAIPDVVERVDRELARYRRRSDLVERTVSQRFAIYRCINNCLPERRGRGWWHDLRPSVIERAPPEAIAGDLALGGGDAVLARAAALAAEDPPRAIALLEARIAQAPRDARALGLLADVMFSSARHVVPRVDATEYIAASTRAARAAHAIDPREPLALLNLGAAEVFGGMVLAQPMAPAIAKLEAAISSGALAPEQRRRAFFFLGRAHQMEGRDRESDGFFRRLLPAWARFLYPFARGFIRAYG